MWARQKRWTGVKAIGDAFAGRVTLTDFLLARISDDGYALDCGLRDHDRSRGGAITPDCWERPEMDCDFRDKREWAAKRRIIREHQEQAGGGCNVCSRHEYPCPTLRFVASVYADHPDYREEWTMGGCTAFNPRSHVKCASPAGHDGEHLAINGRSAYYWRSAGEGR